MDSRALVLNCAVRDFVRSFEACATAVRSLGRCNLDKKRAAIAALCFLQAKLDSRADCFGL